MHDPDNEPLPPPEPRAPSSCAPRTACFIGLIDDLVAQVTTAADRQNLVDAMTDGYNKLMEMRFEAV